LSRRTPETYQTAGLRWGTTASTSTIRVTTSVTVSGDMSVQRVVMELYASLLGREPRDDEWQPFGEHLLTGGSLEDVVWEMLRSLECQLGCFRNPNFRELVAPTPLPREVPRLYLCHVPKTGGTSLREMLMQHFAVQQRCVGLSQRTLPPVAGQAPLFQGHLRPLRARLATVDPGRTTRDCHAGTRAGLHGGEPLRAATSPHSPRPPTFRLGTLALL
jgi:hypothetical protein